MKSDAQRARTPGAGAWTRGERLAVWVVMLAAALWWGGCGRALYSLPDAPPESEWVDAEAVPGEDEQAANQRRVAAKIAATDTYIALSRGEWEQALAHMSQETRNFLDEASGGKGAIAALESGTLVLGGQTARFNPADDFFIADFTTLRDEVPGAEPEAETRNRKEFYAISADGKARKVVFIYETDGWRLHSPYLGTAVIDVNGGRTSSP